MDKSDEDLQAELGGDRTDPIVVSFGDATIDDRLEEALGAGRHDHGQQPASGASTFWKVWA